LDNDPRVLGYYAVAAGSIDRGVAPGALARNTPDSIPVAYLARLAVQRSMQGTGIGRMLLFDALTRCADVSAQLGIRAVVVNPVHEAAANYYRHWGFHDMPADPGALFLTVREIQAELG
jgi:GNAT superfamily N-acetyltransferase